MYAPVQFARAIMPRGEQSGPCTNVITVSGETVHPDVRPRILPTDHGRKRLSRIFIPANDTGSLSRQSGRDHLAPRHGGFHRLPERIQYSLGIMLHPSRSRVLRGDVPAFTGNDMSRVIKHDGTAGMTALIQHQIKGFAGHACILAELQLFHRRGRGGKP